jgi:hypothetical protein
MNRRVHRRSWRTWAALSFLVVGCTARVKSTLEVLIDAPGGVAIDGLDLRIYDNDGLLRQQHIAKPQLPGGVHLSALPREGRLRIVVAGLDAGDKVIYLAGSVTPLPLPANQLSLVLSDAVADADRDGVPDELDDCPAVVDPDQESAAGFGNGPGDACLSSPPDMAPSLPVPGGPSKCPGATLVCDAMSELHPGESFLQSAAAFDNAQVFRGDKSLHLTDNDHLVLQTNLPKPDVYLRAFVYLPSPLPSNAVTLMRVQQREPPYHATELQLVGGKLRTRASRIEALQTSTVSPPLDRWFCVQWQVHVDSAGYAATRIDGVMVPGLDPETTFDTTNSPAYQWVVMAFDAGDTNGTHPATDVWIDELAVDFKPVSCTD